MSLQKRIWQSRIRNLPKDQDFSPAEAESPPVPQPVEGEEVAAEENPTEIQNLPENKAGIGSSFSNNAYVSGGMAGGEGDAAPVTTGMKPGKGGKGPPNRLTPDSMQYWDAREGRFNKRTDLVDWSVKAVVDSINSSREAITNLQTKLGGLTKNLDVTTVVAKKLGSDISTLISSVGSEKAMNILRNEFGGNQPDTAGSQLPPDYTIDPDDIPDNVPGIQPDVHPDGPLMPGVPGPLTPVYVTKPLPVDPDKPFTPSNPEVPEGPGTLDPDLFGPDILDPDERDPEPGNPPPILVTPYGPGGVIITIPGVGVFVVNPDGKGGKWYQIK